MRRRNVSVKLAIAILSTLLFVLLAFPSAARADEYDAAFARAIAAKERALDRNDPASWQDAIDLFDAACAVRPTKEAKYELGSAASRLKQDDLAVDAYESAIALGLDNTAREKAAAFVEEK